MNKRFTILLLLVSILVICINSGSVYAISSGKRRPFEEIHLEIGYKTVEKAVREFEDHFERDLKLPLRVPPISFTHYFGRFNNLSGNANDTLDIEYLNENSPENHYKIVVRPAKYKIPIKDKYLIKDSELKNGKKARYINLSGHNVLVFEIDNWQYMLSNNKRVSNTVTPENLVQIANSIEYTHANSE